MTMIDKILIGAVAPLGPRAAPSGIDKHPIEGRVFLGPEGFAGDAQGDRKHHGGVEKAVHHYAYDHYAHWISTIGNRDVLTKPGAFGENLSTRGMTEQDVAIGDTFRLGHAVLQISQGRQPCWKLNARFETADMAVRVQKSGMTGWYYRVLETGYVELGDELHLIDRISPEWTIQRLWRVLYVDTMNRDELAAMIGLDHLPESWRNYAHKRLQTRQVEDWSRRLHGETSPSA
ncbi:MOSC domain-containing protein [Brucella sp. TWI559]|uniref:MOSC domain-containing protein n=1 Tax=Ochrobactrum sp. Marseille-Q0166 TaxID=2761105 RepID=UPI00165535FE|nr:MOSC domain-containing protein [Ochrobactrum sp. Marseille-Q0166]MBC8719561.1 MOSC domain-containing protein [Ochrobactrum sp. Marseille-Q0166]